MLAASGSQVAASSRNVLDSLINSPTREGVFEMLPAPNTAPQKCSPLMQPSTAALVHTGSGSGGAPGSKYGMAKQRMEGSRDAFGEEKAQRPVQRGQWATEAVYRREWWSHGCNPPSYN